MFKLSRYELLFKLMEEENLDGVMIGPSSDMSYLINYEAHVDERLNVLVLLKDRSYFHIASLINYEEAKKKYPEDAKFYIYSDGEGFHGAVQKAFEDFNLIQKRIGVNEGIRGIDLLDFQNYMNVTFVNAHHMMENYRIQKSKSQVAALKKAGEIADQVMVAIKAFIKPGVYEYEIANEIKRLYKAFGSDGLSFEPIVATGKNSSRPHYNEGTSKVEVGDNVVIDCGCKVDNMCSDSSRTFFVGEPSEKQKKIYEICLKATLQAQEKAKANVTAGDVDQAARSVIEGAGYGDCFLNRTGHGIGYSVHEAPYIKPDSPVVLEEGMAFSIEPGIYIAGEFGMRVENILVIENGVGVSMNHSPYDLEKMIIEI
ncbi:MAG: aminopeptidase P family protein [Clostridia bacterium]|nr:aminopeptidase P family protein [Clostridia bacterium]